jgi:hypothetical protein
MKMKTATQDLYLSKEIFDNELENNLLIINYPSSRRPYYLCEKSASTQEKVKIRVFITK